MKRKISARNEKTITWVKKKMIVPELIIDYYGIRFFLKFIKSLRKENRKGPLLTDICYPNFKVIYSNLAKAHETFHVQLKECGFKLKEQFEPFIDEDTGKIVHIKRQKIYCLGVRKVKKTHFSKRKIQH